MKQNHGFKDQGQSLALFAIVIFVFMGVLAITIDGGLGLFYRRMAQNAADAGALAGAAELCQFENVSQAEAVAVNYAKNRNRVTNAVAAANKSDWTVQVTATITYNTLVARMWEQNDVTVNAVAKAGCFSPGLGTGVLPIAWMCKPNVLNAPPGPDCVNNTITFDQLQTYNLSVVNPGLHVIMDDYTYTKQHPTKDTDLPLDFYCVEDFPPAQYPGLNTIVCDFDNPPDGEADFFSSGGRSWIDLDGKAGLNGTVNCDTSSSEGIPEMTEWIAGGYTCDVKPHTWIGENTGNLTNVYGDVKTLENSIVIVPVYDAICPNADPMDPLAVPKCDYHAGDTVNWLQPTYFHINAFAAFYLSCVQDVFNKSIDYDTAGDSCPGIRAWALKNWELIAPGKKKIDIMSVEGYFLRGYVPELSGKGGTSNTGVYTIYLIQP